MNSVPHRSQASTRSVSVSPAGSVAVIIGGRQNSCCAASAIGPLFPQSPFRKPITKANHCKQASYPDVYRKYMVPAGKNYAINREIPIVRDTGGDLSTPA